MTPKKIHILTRDLEILGADTPVIRAWVNINPHEERTEYTDLSQVWHNAKEEPEKGKLIIGVDEDGVSIYKWVGQDEYGWLSFAECDGLIRWAYIKDLLPRKGNEKDMK